jgi:general secretion pathway protein D
MRPGRGAAALVVLVAGALLAAGCASRWAYRQGKNEARRANWDMAVARFTKALEGDPENIGYRIALDNARIQASRAHYALARKHLAADQLEKAAEELEIAVKYDGGNKSAADDLVLVRARIARREEERRRLADFDAMKGRAAARVSVPVLSPRSQVPINMRFAQQSRKTILETLGKLAGVNVLFDEQYRDAPIDVNLSGVTFQEALDQITFTNRLFYKVLDQNTIIVVPEGAQKRRQYDETMLRTFYLENADVKEVEAIVKTIGGIQKTVSNQTLNAITIMGTPDQLAIAERIIEANDKARGEVVVEVVILEVNRDRLKRYGIELSNYEIGSTLSPTGGPNELAGGFTTLRAHLLSSLNLSDFVVNIPSTLLTRFLQTDDTARILAQPRLRAAEGKPTAMSIGTEVPIPVTTFTATQPGTTTFAPATSFNYRNVGVNLRITPKVNPNGDILLELSAEFSLLGADRNVGTGDNPIIVPTFLTRKVEGLLRLRDGETSMIGGLLQGRESASMSGVLGMHNVPILRNILTSNRKEDNDSEIVISITPHLVRAPKLREEDLVSLPTGTVEIPRVPGARPPLFGPLEETPAVTAPVPAPIPMPGGDPVPQSGVPGVPPTPESEPQPAPAPTPPPAAGTTPAAASADGARALLSPPELTVKAGENALVSLVLMGVRDLNGLEVALSYDPNVVEAQEATAGSLLTLDGASVRVDRSMEPGRIRVRMTRPAAVTGSGVVAQFSVRALRAGSTTLTPESVVVLTGGGAARIATPSAGRLTVTP